MNSAHSYTEGMDIEPIKPITMDLNAKREQLLAEKEKHQVIKDQAHKKILEINSKLRKLAFVARDAEELFEEEKPLV